MAATSTHMSAQMRAEQNRRVERLLLKHSYKLEHGFTTLGRLAKQKAACGLTPATLGKKAKALGISVHRGRPTRSTIASLKTDLTILRRVSRRLESRLGGLGRSQTKTRRR